MTPEKIDKENLTVSPKLAETSEDLHVAVQDGVFVIVTQAFGPTGASLVGLSDVAFDGFPAVTLRVQAAGRDELVHLSPFHGDRRKVGLEGLAPGTVCRLLCPVSGQPLEKIRHDETTGVEFFAIYLTPKLSQGEMVALSNRWDDYQSHIIDHFEIISAWAPKDARE